VVGRTALDGLGGVFDLEDVPVGAEDWAVSLISVSKSLRTGQRAIVSGSHGGGGVGGGDGRRMKSSGVGRQTRGLQSTVQPLALHLSVVAGRSCRPTEHDGREEKSRRSFGVVVRWFDGAGGVAQEGSYRNFGSADE
jgi:hypothetical protein